MQLTTVLSSVWVSVWVDPHSDQPQPFPQSMWQQQHSQEYYAEVYTGIVGVTAVLSLLRLVGMAVGSIRAANIMHNAMATSLMLTTCRFYDVNPVGRIMNRCV